MNAYILLLIGICATCTAGIPVKSTRDLGDDIDDLLSYFPMEKLQQIINEHIKTDPEVQAQYKYFQSDKVKTLVDEIDSAKEVKKVFSYIYDHGYTEIYDVINSIHDFFGWDHVNVETRKLLRNVRNLPSHRTLDDMIREIYMIVPYITIPAWAIDKLKTSPDFQGLYDILLGQEFQDFAEKLYNEPNTQDIIEDLNELDFNVDNILHFLKRLFRLNASDPSN